MTGPQLDDLVLLARERLDGALDPGAMRRQERQLLASWGRRSGARVRTLVAVGAVAAAALLGLGSWRALRPEASVTVQARGLVADGTSFRAIDADREGDLTFSDGTRISLTSGTAARVTARTAKGPRLALVSGRIHCDVVPQARTLWVIDAGPYSIAAQGTVFEATWTPDDDSLEIDPSRGTVTVTGREVTDPLTVHAGERLRIHGGAITIDSPSLAPVSPVIPTAVPDASAPEPDTVDGIDGTEPASPERTASHPHTRSAEKSWARMIAEGDTVTVLRDARALGLDRALATRPASDLLALGDAARYERQSDLARRAYQKLRARFGGTREAADAAFLIGRALEATNARQSRGWYQKYLDETPDGAYAAEALGREMILSQGADTARATGLAADYLRKYPSGPYASSARALRSSPPTP